MDRERVRRIEAAERHALLDGDARMPEDVRAGLGRRLGRWGEVLAIATDRQESILFNRTLGVGIEQPADDALLDAIAAHYAAGPNHHAVQISPIAEPADLGERLFRRGYRHDFSWIKWHRDTAPAPAVACALRVAAAEARDLEAYAATAGLAFGVPPATARNLALAIGRPGWRHFIAWDEAAAVAVGAVFFDRGTAWLGGGGTLPTHRGRGAQGALIAARLDAARDAGCTLVTVETGPDTAERPNPSYRNVARAGFEIAYERPSWVFEPGDGAR